MDAFFQTFDPIHDHIRSYEQFIQAILELVDGTILEGVQNTARLYDARVSVPVLEEHGIKRYAYPSECRIRNLTYACNLSCTLSIDDVVYPDVVLGKIPVMVGSTYCMTSLTECPKECMHDPGGYFIVNGSEKTILAQERMVSNSLYAFQTPDGLKTVEYRAQKEGELKVHRFVVFQKRGRVFARTQLHDSIPLIEFCTERLRIEKHVAIETIGGRYDFGTDVSNVDPVLILPNIPNLEEKFSTITTMTRMLYGFENGMIQQTDRDHVRNKRVDWSGDLLFGLFKQIWARFTRDALNVLQKKDVYILTPNSLFRSMTITNGIRYSLSTGNWGISSRFRSGVSQVLNRMNLAASMSQLRRISSPVGKEGKVIKPRMLHASSYGRTCPSETPEGSNTGLLKSLAVGAMISSRTPSAAIAHLLQSTPGYSVSIRPNETIVFLNGVPHGSVQYPQRAIEHLRSYRRRCDIAHDVSLVYDSELEIVCILTDPGRLVRPLWIRRDEEPPSNLTWYEYLEQGYIEYLDGYEETSAVVAATWNDVASRPKRFTHVEIHTNFVFGMGTSEIPFANHSQAPRIVYQAAQKKQAIGVPFTNPHTRIDSGTHQLWYPQKPIVTTEFPEHGPSKELGYAGHNCVVAIMCYSGFNQEDSVIVSQSAVDRGLFRSYLFKSVVEECGTEETFGRPGDRVQHRKFAQYNRLDPEGLPPIDEVIEKQDILVGRMAKKLGKTYDTSIPSKFETSRVNHIALSMGQSNTPMVKVQTREMRVPEIGCKVSNRAAQKGTIGVLLSQEDMPFCPRTGMVPDVIMNPHAIPSRMTISQILETVLGKGGILDGRFCDGTAFSRSGDSILNEARTTLLKHGYDAHGMDRMVNGMTGEPLEAEIFTGPVYYQRLKHMVADKYHARARGPVQGITRQPTEGRSRAGSIRAGEMERDAFISHGVSAVLNDRFMECSDKYDTQVCRRCGLFASQVCRVCGAEGELQDIVLPYATKLLFQELMSMGITCKVEMVT